MKNKDLNKYLDVLINKIWKIMPLMQENQENALKYIKSLNVELKGAKNYFSSTYFTSIVFSIDGLSSGITDYNVVRAKVLECINYVNRIKKEIKGIEESPRTLMT